MIKALTINIFSILLFFLFQSCNSTKLQRSDFIGIWKASDGGIIEFYNNGKCKIRGVNYYKIYPFEELKGKLLNVEGIWNFTSVDEPKVHLSYYENNEYNFKGETEKHKAGFDLSISGQGIFGNKPPLYLYEYIGDPDDIDENNKYVFIKQ